MDSGKPRSEPRSATEANGEITSKSWFSSSAHLIEIMTDIVTMQELHDAEKGDLPYEEQNQEAKGGPGKSVAEKFPPGRENLGPKSDLGLRASAAPQLAHGGLMEAE